MKCPNCSRDFIEIPGQKFCSFCGGALDSAVADTEPSGQRQTSRDEEPELEFKDIPEAQREEYCPWEDLEHLGFIQGFLGTLQQSLFKPQEFFARMPIQGGMLNPLLFGLIVGSVGAMVSYLAGLVMDHHPFMINTRFTGAMSIVVALSIPVFVAIGILAGAVLLHVALFMLGGARQPFEATFRIVAYASGPDLISAVPMIGWVITLIWKFYITVIGVKEVHGLTTGKSAVAVCLPILLCCGVAAAGLIMAMMGAAGPSD